MTRMRSAVTVLMMSAAALAMPLAAQTASAADPILKPVRQRIEASDFRATGRLVHIAANGDRVSYHVSIKGHWFPDGLRVLYTIKEASVRVLLHMSASGTTTVDTVQGAAKPARLQPSHWGDSFLGTDFSYEDLLEGQFYWKSQEALPPAGCGARHCVVLKSTPSPEDHSQYASVISDLDSTIYYPITVIKTTRGSGLQKEFTYEGLRQSSGVWSASQLEAKVQGKPGSTLLIIERGSEKAKLTQKSFDLSASSPPEDD